MSLVVVDEAGKKVTGLADIGEYVNKNAGNAIYSGNTTINQQITENKNDIANNTSAINQHTIQINQNAQNISDNSQRITDIENSYVTNVTDNGNDTWTVNQTGGDNVTIKDTYVTNVEHSWSEDGQHLVTTVKQNQGKQDIETRIVQKFLQ